jgi:hypothetical protein
MHGFFLVGSLITVAIVGMLMNQRNDHVPQQVKKTLEISGAPAPAKMQDVPQAVEKAMKNNMDEYQKRLDSMSNP